MSDSSLASLQSLVFHLAIRLALESLLIMENSTPDGPLQSAFQELFPVDFLSFKFKKMSIIVLLAFSFLNCSQEAMEGGRSYRS